MKLLRHILVAAAMLAAAMPCRHAAGHGLHVHGAGAEPLICAEHSCSCHSCDENPCSDELEMPQELTIASVSATATTTSVPLFVFTETKPAARQAPHAVVGILATIQTVQLLI